MMTSESTANIFKAFAAFQSDVAAPAKNGKGNYGTYVLLDDLVMLRKALAKHGLSFTQDTISNTDGIGVMTTVMHESGEWFGGEALLLPMEKRTPQGAGSAITYARRYSLAAALGVASENDDDAQHAEDEQKPKAKKADEKPEPLPDAPAVPYKDAFDTLRATAELKGTKAKLAKAMNDPKNYDEGLERYVAMSDAERKVLERIAEGSGK